jgi:hypothetical protein
MNDKKTEKGTSFELNPFKTQKKNIGLNSSDWKMMILNASDGEGSDGFGFSVSISGHYALIGAPYDDNITGSAYIFTDIGTTWIQVAKLTAADGVPEDGFGYSVSLDGDTCVIGAVGDNDNGNSSGSAYVFTRTGTTWTQQAKLLASDGESTDSFGKSVSINGDFIVIGAPSDDNSTGSAYVFERDGTTWMQQTKLLASDGTPTDHFGNSVSMSGDRIVIGIIVYRDDNSTESVYVFERDGTTWTQTTQLVASDSEPSRFGNSVSIHGDDIIIGAPFSGIYAYGAAYIFKYNGTTWAQQVKLTGSGDPLESFGSSVSIDEEYATTIGMSIFNHTGSVYIFKRNGTTWSLDAKLTGFVNDFMSFGNMISNNGACVLVGNCGYNHGIGSAYIFWKPSPQFEITSKGSTIYVKNIGDANATNVSVNRQLEGGLIVMGKDKTVIIPSISIEETKKARLGMIIGLGKTTITFFLSCDENVTETWSRQAIVLYFFLFFYNNYKSL